MKLGIMQPYFFPYLGYFDLINYVDLWIIFDTPQYIRHGWVNRNRILHPNSGWQYIMVPTTKHSQKTKINQIEISYSDDWKKKFFGQLMHYKKNAPYYPDVIDLLEECFDNREVFLSKFNYLILKRICQKLNITTEIVVFSEMELLIEEVSEPGDWALNISKALNASEYINPPGGENLFNKEKFSENGIKLSIQSFVNMDYFCKNYNFEPNLSIIDVLMWNSPGDIKKHLDDYRTLRQIFIE